MILAHNTANMTAKQQREIVIEFERVQLIRTRAKTTLAYCDKCRQEADFVDLSIAAQLFEIPDGDLAAFVASNPVHYTMDVDICIPSLLAIMQAKQNGGGPRLIGTSTGSTNNLETEKQ